jgi:hypothetical protein
MASRWIVATIAVVLALTDAASAQSPRDAYVRQQQQDRFLRVIEQLNDSQIVFLYPRGSGFTSFLKSAASSPTRTSIRLCDRVSGALNEQYLSGIAVTREQWSGSFRYVLGGLFKVPVEFVDPRTCDIQSLSNADAVIVVGTQAKTLLGGLARDGRLMDSHNLPSLDFYKIGDTVEVVSTSIVDAARKAAEDRRRQHIGDDARRRAEMVESAQRALLDLERQARAGDHAAALKGQELARNAGNRSKEVDFRILSAETGPSALKLEVATDLAKGRNGFPTEPDKARRLLEQAVAAGHAPAIVALAGMEASPSLYSEDNRRAYELLEQAVALGDATAGEKLRQLRESVAQNEWDRTEKRIMKFAPWAGLGLVLGAAGFVAYLRRADIGRSLSSAGASSQQASGGIDARNARNRNLIAAAIGVVAIVVSLGIYDNSLIPFFGPSRVEGSDSAPLQRAGSNEFDADACFAQCHSGFDRCYGSLPTKICGDARGQCIDTCGKAAECQIYINNNVPRASRPTYCR